MDSLPFAKPEKRKKDKRILKAIYKPQRVDKRQEPTDSDLETRRDYVEKVDCVCEICKEFGQANIHHHLKQQKYYFEHPSNYSFLCQWNCHRLVESNKKQFIREVKIAKNSKYYGMDKGDLFDYMHKLKEEDNGY